MSAAAERRRRLADELVDKGAIRSPWLHQAFAGVPREVFVPRFRLFGLDPRLLDSADPDQHEEWRGSIAGSLLRLTPLLDPDASPDAEVETVHGRFLDLPGAFMPMRTDAQHPSRDGEDWDTLVYDHTNPHHGSTELDPALVADDPALHLLSQLHLAGHRLRGFLRSTDRTELSGTAIDGSWFSVHLTPDSTGRHPVTQGGPHRLWDTVDNPDSGYRWPLPL